MIFDICEFLREQIAEINDKVVNKYKKVIEAQEEKEREENAPQITNMDTLNYIPVNKETFSKWCGEFLEKLKEQEELEKTEQDLRKTGKELFMEKATLNELDDLNLEDEEDLDGNAEESKQMEEDEDEGPGALYDKDLFAQELDNADEDVDFD